MIDPHHLRDLIIRPTLQKLNLWSLAAETLVLGTAIHESRLVYLRQVGGGPALGIYQVEPTTHEDLRRNYLDNRPTLKNQVATFLASAPEPDAQLATNLAYATVICRLLYYRAPAPLPDASDVDGLAAYWKAHYNTPSGKGTAAEWAKHYRECLI